MCTMQTAVSAFLMIILMKMLYSFSAWNLGYKTMAK